MPTWLDDLRLLLESEFEGKQSALAEELDVDDATVWRWLKGRTSNPRQQHRDRIRALRQRKAAIHNALAEFTEDN